MRLIASVLIRAIVASVASSLAAWLVSVTGRQGGGANIGAGLLAFAVLILVALIWGAVDGWREDRWLRAMVMWVVVSVLVGVAASLQAQGFSGPLDVDVLMSDLGVVTPFVAGLVLVPSVLGLGVGWLARRGRGRA